MSEFTDGIKELGRQVTQMMRDKGTLVAHLPVSISRKVDQPLSVLLSGLLTMGVTPAEIGAAIEALAKETELIYKALEEGKSADEIADIIRTNRA